MVGFLVLLQVRALGFGQCAPAGLLKDVDYRNPVLTFWAKGSVFHNLDGAFR